MQQPWLFPEALGPLSLLGAEGFSLEYLSQSFQQPVSLPHIITTEGSLALFLCRQCSPRPGASRGAAHRSLPGRAAGTEMLGLSVLPVPSTSSICISTSEPTSARCMQMELLGYACQV